MKSTYTFAQISKYVDALQKQQDSVAKVAFSSRVPDAVRNAALDEYLELCDKVERWEQRGYEL